MISLNSRLEPQTVRRQLRLLLAAALVACFSLASTTAAAQDDQDDQGIDEKLDAYWSVDREMPSIQERTFQRDGRIGIGLYSGISSSEPFYYYYPVGVRASYFFNNHVGVELESSFMDSGALTHDTELTDFLETRNEFDKARHTEDRFLWRTNALLQWHPLYGKLAFLQRKLSHFDFNLTAGLGVVSVERPDVNRQTVESTVAPQAVLGAGIQFFATSDIVVRLEGRGYVYQGAKSPTNQDSFWSQLQVPTEFLLGASYMF